MIRRRTLTVASLAIPFVARAQSGPRAVPVAQGIANGWALAFLPNGDMLVTEREGRLRRITADGVSAPLAGVPQVHARRQGGLLDLVLGPDFARDRSVFLTYAEPGDGGASTALARATLTDAGLADLRVIFRQAPKTQGDMHFGSRIVFARDGNLFLALGDRMQPNEAQNLDSHIGKIVRIRPDGSVPSDNPFARAAGGRPELWSWGHRNIQAAALHPQTGRLWTVEHGARGGDEINIPQVGRNYGWPVISYGVNYNGTRIGVGTAREGLEQPIHYWDPSIAPSGMAFLTSDRYPGWRGSLFVGALRGAQLVRLTLDGERVTGQEVLLRDLGERIRDVRQGPDGLIYVVTDARNGAVMRLLPG
jgi:glucose/arabinose dehydrogenase